MPEITPYIGDQLLMQAFKDRDARIRQDRQDAISNELHQYQINKLRNEDRLAQEKQRIFTSNPTMQTETTRTPSESALQYSLPNADPSQFLDVKEQRVPISETDQRTTLVNSLLDKGYVEDAKKLLDTEKIRQDMKQKQEAGFSFDLYNKFGTAWKEKAKELAPKERWDDIERTEVNPFYLKYTASDGMTHLVDKEGKATIYDSKDKTNDIKEYEYAVKGGYKGSFDTWQIKLKKAGAANTNIDLGLSKPVVTKLQEGIIDSQTQIDAFKQMKSIFKPEYLTYKTQAAAAASNIGDKLGIPTTDFINERQQWYQASKSQFLAYRKWVTGVAGGEKEMAEIAKSFPDPDKNSPSQYNANLKQAEINARRLQQRYNMFMVNGIKPTKEQLSSIPLDSVILPEEKIKGKVSPETQKFLDSLKGK
jgi:hypothetical protein